MFCKKRCPQNLTKFTGKYLSQSTFFDKLAGLRPATLVKERLWHRCFPMNFTEFLKLYITPPGDCSWNWTNLRISSYRVTAGTNFQDKPIGHRPHVLVTSLLCSLMTLENLSISKYGMGTVIEFGLQVQLMNRIPLHTFLQIMMMISLLHGHVNLKNIDISSYGWTTIIKF